MLLYGRSGKHIADNSPTLLPQELQLDGNPMPALPSTLGRCATLEVLSVQAMSDPIQALPLSISGCENLVVIRAARNDIFDLPDCFGSICRVEYLDFNENQLESLPPSFLNCDRLKVLLLRKNQLRELFKGTSNLYALHTLDISYNRMRKLPRGLGSLVQYHALKNHDLSFNSWEMPPPEILEQGEAVMLKYVGALWNATQTDQLAINMLRISAMRGEIMELHGISELNLDDNCIVEIPVGISKMHKLEEISMVRNRIKVLPDQLFELKNLERIKFDDNEITEIPSGIVRLKAGLAWLCLERNFITSFPPELAQMETLEVFNVSRNGLQPDIRLALDRGLDCLLAYMRKWTVVRFEGRVDLAWYGELLWEPFAEFPSSLWSYAASLRVIDLNDNAIRAIPQNITQLLHLEELHLQSNELTALPYCLATLKRMKRLELKDNLGMFDPPYELVLRYGLKGIWRYLTSLHAAPALRSLVLDKFDLVDLQINDMVKTTLEDLSQLYMRARTRDTSGIQVNPLEMERIEYRLSLFDLEALSLDDNRFAEFPEQIVQLTRLTLLSFARNELQRITEEVSRLSSLTVLHLESNRLHELPSQLSSASDLRKLTLQHNKFKIFPSALLALARLEVLNLAQNGLEEVDVHFPAKCRALRMLSLRGNAVRVLPPDVGALRALVLLDLAGNYILTLPDSLPGCSRLRALYLDSCPLSAVPSGVLGLPRLQRLRLANTLITGLPPKLGLLTTLRELDISGTDRLMWPPPETVAKGMHAVLAFLRWHQQTLGEELSDSDEDELSAFLGEEVGPLNINSILDREIKVEDYLAELAELKDELAVLEKQHVKHSRIGNKSKVAELEERMTEINEERRELALLIQVNEEMRLIDEDTLVVESELALLDEREAVVREAAQLAAAQSRHELLDDDFLFAGQPVGGEGAAGDARAPGSDPFSRFGTPLPPQEESQPLIDAAKEQDLEISVGEEMWNIQQGREPAAELEEQAAQPTSFTEWGSEVLLSQQGQVLETALDPSGQSLTLQVDETGRAEPDDFLEATREELVAHSLESSHTAAQGAQVIVPGASSGIDVTQH